MLAARKQSRDSYAESDVEGPEPVDVGAVGNLTSGVNVLGGTPIKPQSERMTQESQLHRCREVFILSITSGNRYGFEVPMCPGVVLVLIS